MQALVQVTSVDDIVRARNDLVRTKKSLEQMFVFYDPITVPDHVQQDINDVCVREQYPVFTCDPDEYMKCEGGSQYVVWPTGLYKIRSAL